MKCILFHKWIGCECERCGNSRHKWDGCLCSSCGDTRDTGHRWDGCTCSTCRKKRDEGHSWNGCKCVVCYTMRDEGHSWDGCKCSNCHLERHEFEHCTCKRCGKVDARYHEWKDSRCIHCGSEWVPLLKGLSLQESELVYPFLVKLKQYFRGCAVAYSGGFGGCCDACSSPISEDKFYYVAGWARCEPCMDRALLVNTDWYFYLGKLDTWVPTVPSSFVNEAAALQKAIEKLRM